MKTTDTDFDDYLPFESRGPQTEDERQRRTLRISRWFFQRDDYLALGLAHQTSDDGLICTHYFPLCHDSEDQP